MGGERRVQPRTVLLLVRDPRAGDRVRAALSQAADFAIVEEAMLRGARPDAVLFDACLPVEEGETLMRSLRRRFPQAKAIAISDCPPDDGLITAARVGADGHVQAGQPAVALLAALRRALSDEAMVPAAIALAALRKLSSAGTNGHSPMLRQLTTRQTEILQFVAEGRTNKEIAHVLGLAEETVANHVKAILQRLGVHKRTEAAWMLRDGAQEPA